MGCANFQNLLQTNNFTFVKVAYSMLVNKTYTEKMNALVREGTPFLFIIDFLALHPMIFPLDELPDGIRFSTPMFPDKSGAEPTKELILKKHPLSYRQYQKKFSLVKKEISQGNSFLINLTQPTPIECNWSLEDIYLNSRAAYKLLVPNRFVVFSPEVFVRISGQQISTYPMKGTIDSSLPGAEKIILNDEKETAEHYTIVDLMRNDLSRISSGVRVERFRYIEKIRTHEKEILQVSSEITGILPPNFRDKLGDYLFTMLPAGSISGAPKDKTLRILKAVEGYERGYYTGIFGIFDGKNLDSAVMIRFIEQIPSGLVFKSGGGITHKSKANLEYQELIDKVYVPFARNHTD